MEDARFQVEDLDEAFGSGRFGDLLASRDDRNWLVECRGASGSPGEEATYDVQKHLETWPELGRWERLDGGVLVVSHNLRMRGTEIGSPPVSRHVG